MIIPRWNPHPQGQFYVNVYRQETMLAKYDHEWLEFGPPHATRKYTQQELEAKGMVGAYIRERKVKQKSGSGDQ